jgi:hypothetical protein
MMQNTTLEGASHFLETPSDASSGAPGADIPPVSITADTVRTTNNMAASVTVVNLVVTEGTKRLSKSEMSGVDTSTNPA